MNNQEQKQNTCEECRGSGMTMTPDEIEGLRASDACLSCKGTGHIKDSSLSNFVRNASDEKKEEVFKKVIDQSIEDQKAVMEQNKRVTGIWNI